MTATVPEAPSAKPNPASAPPHPALSGLCWVAWRQHRTALLAILAAFAVGALALVYYGVPMHRDLASLGLAACLPGSGSEPGTVSRAAQACSAGLADFHGDQNRVSQLMAQFLPLPVVFGLFRQLRTRTDLFGGPSPADESASPG